jgi:hypothetical protein
LVPFFFFFEVCLELLRHVEPCLVSAHADSSHYSIPVQAEREYQRRSVRDRAKFDGEAGKARFFECFQDSQRGNRTHRLSPLGLLRPRARGAANALAGSHRFAR